MTIQAVGFDYAKQIEDPVRDDLVLAHRRAWERLAEDPELVNRKVMLLEFAHDTFEEAAERAPNKHNRENLARVRKKLEAALHS